MRGLISAVVLAVVSLAANVRGEVVALVEKGDRVVLQNGVVAAEIVKTSGDVTSVRYKGAELLAGPAYLDWVEEGNNHLRGTYRLVVDPATNGGERAEIAVVQPWDGKGEAFDVELHHVLRKGDTGIYSFAVFGHRKEYPAAAMAQSRQVFRVREELFDTAMIEDKRHLRMPPPGTPMRVLGPKESMQATAGPFSGQIFDKYLCFVDAGGHFVHGWAGTQGLGVWLVWGSNEAQNGGPTKQHNTAHFPQVLLKILTCGHYGAAGVQVPAGEQWQKVYGPWMLYVNEGATREALWANAKQKAAAEEAAWPPAWMEHAEFTPAAGRGVVRGQFVVKDAGDPRIKGAGAWVGLAAASPDWQQQSLGYQYWVRADGEGRFALRNVRPGTYTLYAFVDGAFGEFRRDGVEVKGGGEVNLATLQWTPERHGRQVWQIGVPDRTAKEFRHGDDYRQWGLPAKYAEDFPKGVTFTIGKSSERLDWNYAQPTVQKEGAWVGDTWTVVFTMPESVPGRGGRGNLRMGFAAANNAGVRVTVNGKPVGGTGNLGRDNAMIREGIHGQYQLRDVGFDAGLLKAGENRIGLTLEARGSNLKNVMYDALRLEVEGEAPR
jgi:rhamnogalacturonan endolyase